MKLPPMRLPGIITGGEIFRIASLCLYTVLVLHTMFTMNSIPAPGSTARATVMIPAMLLAAALARCFRSREHGQRWLLAELGVALYVVSSIALQKAIPSLALPWLVGLAGIFPLTFEASISLLSVVAISATGLALNIALDAPAFDWLPYLFATLFAGISTMMLSRALHCNLAALRQAERDITERKTYETRLEHVALHDPLTGLPNRRHLLKTISEAISQSQDAPVQLAMLFCDLDLFKSVNDTHGHDVGDQCLMELTRRILAVLPSEDFVARFGGNEFIILSKCSRGDAKLKADMVLVCTAIDRGRCRRQNSIEYWHCYANSRTQKPFRVDPRRRRRDVSGKGIRTQSLRSL